MSKEIIRNEEELAICRNNNVDASAVSLSVKE